MELEDNFNDMEEREQIEFLFFEWFKIFHSEKLKFEPRIIEITEVNIRFGMKKHMGILNVSIEKIKTEMKCK